MSKDLFVITGEIERLKELAIKMERKLMESANPEDVDFEALADMASMVEDVVNNLNSELID